MRQHTREPSLRQQFLHSLSRGHRERWIKSSRSISENCTWGQRKRFSDGKVCVPYSRFLGYDRGEEGGLVINEKEAVTIRLIYKMFLEGATPHSIAKHLTGQGILSPDGKEKWNQSAVKSILQNEKYKGDALLQIFCSELIKSHRNKKAVRTR
jgi:hypothetical protein